VLRIFGPKREEDRLWRKLRNDELRRLYSSLNIVRVFKSRRLRWAGYVSHGGREMFTGFWLGGPKVRDHWVDLGIGGRITLSWTLGRWIDGVNWIWLAQDRVQWHAFVNTVMNLLVP
jgi:hypothetical protein